MIPWRLFTRAGRAGLLLFLCALAGCNLTRTDGPPVDTSRPQITFLAPEADAVLTEGEDTVILLAAQDPNGPGIARIELLVDDLPHQSAQPEVSAAVPVFTAEMNWLAQGPGLHAFTAIAYRPDGSTSLPVTIRVLVVPRADATPSPPAQVGRSGSPFVRI